MEHFNRKFTKILELLSVRKICRLFIVFLWFSRSFSFEDEVRKLQETQALIIHVVSEDFLKQITTDHSSMIMEGCKISSWQILPHVRQQTKVDEEAKSKSNCLYLFSSGLFQEIDCGYGQIEMEGWSTCSFWYKLGFVLARRRQTLLLYNEYVVYNTGQIQLESILRVNFQHKYRWISSFIFLLSIEIFSKQKPNWIILHFFILFLLFLIYHSYSITFTINNLFPLRFILYVQVKEMISLAKTFRPIENWMWWVEACFCLLVDFISSLLFGFGLGVLMFDRISSILF